jgi:UDP-2,3-diacylglucosamine hydrolase
MNRLSEHLFISDLHLSGDRPETVQLFLDFLSHRATLADHLYILGDLFDIWIGDDDEQSPIPQITEALKILSASGTQLSLMHGNRDFLIGEEFCQRCGADLLADPTNLKLFGTTTLLMHGDLLCTDDQAYQAFRQQVRATSFIEQFTALPLEARRIQAKSYREQSGEANAEKSEEIMDVNQETVSAYIRKHAADRLIHGHTHRPADHRLMVDGEEKVRLVLGDWHADHAEIISLSDAGIVRERYTGSR